MAVRVFLGVFVMLWLMYFAGLMCDQKNDETTRTLGALLGLGGIAAGIGIMCSKKGSA